jgi:hypothetical protein
MIFNTIVILTFWIAFSVVIGIRAKYRNRDRAAWTLLSLLISPLLALIFLLILPPLQPRPRPRPRLVTESPEARTVRIKRQDRQAIIGATVAVGLILSFFGGAFLLAKTSTPAYTTTSTYRSNYK